MTNAQNSIATNAPTNVGKHKPATNVKAGADGSEKKTFEDLLKSSTSKVDASSETKLAPKIETHKKSKSKDEEPESENHVLANEGAMQVVHPKKDIEPRAELKLENKKVDQSEADEDSLSSELDLKAKKPSVTAASEQAAKEGDTVSHAAKPLVKEAVNIAFKKEFRSSRTSDNFQIGQLAEKSGELKFKAQSSKDAEVSPMMNSSERIISNKPKLAFNETPLAAFQSVQFAFRGEGTPIDTPVRDQVMDRVSPELKAMQRINLVANGMQAVQSTSATNIISLQLHPIGLGRLQAHIHKQDGTLKVDLVVESKHTLDVLNADINGLKSSLRALGVLDQNINITLAQSQTIKEWHGGDQSNLGFDQEDPQQAFYQERAQQGHAGRGPVEQTKDLDAVQSARHPIYGGNRLLI